jgi:hypothetical protein
MQFVDSLQWWGDAGLGDSNMWHFHPFGFIQHFRKCEWFSLDGMIDRMPKRSKAYQQMKIVLTAAQNFIHNGMTMVIPPRMHRSINRTS